MYPWVLFSLFGIYSMKEKAKNEGIKWKEKKPYTEMSKKIRISLYP